MVQSSKQEAMKGVHLCLVQFVFSKFLIFRYLIQNTRMVMMVIEILPVLFRATIRLDVLTFLFEFFYRCLAATLSRDQFLASF